MLARRTNPAVQLRELLEVSLSRGTSFDQAWRHGWSKVRWPADSTETKEWKDALKETRPEWEMAYIGVCGPFAAPMGVLLAAA